MKILFFGDVVGRAGREAVAQHLPGLKKELAADMAIVNGENAAHGRGLTKKICLELQESGADCVTGGDHIWDQREILTDIDKIPFLLRPLNFPEETPGQGTLIHQLQDGRKVLVVHALGRTFMNPLDDPFAAVTKILQNHTLGKTVDAIFMDFHAEATSEKMAMGHFLDGKISAIVGSHTHIPTADAQILPGSTAYMSDAGMCGDYNSVIGVKKDIPLQRFTRGMSFERFEPADEEATLCGTFIETDDKTGLAKRIEPIRKGPRLQETIPVA